MSISMASRTTSQLPTEATSTLAQSSQHSPRSLPPDDDTDELFIDSPQLRSDDDEDSGDELNENLEEAVRRIQQRTLLSKFEDDKSERSSSPQKDSEHAARAQDALGYVENPEVVDDFIRNFLVAKEMNATLDAFQNEWYELLQLGKLPPEDLEDVPNVYQKNFLLESKLKAAREELNGCKQICEKLKSMYEKARKERAYFKMHQTRTGQEKLKLQADVKRLTRTLDELDSAARAANARADNAMKDRTMLKLERDRLAGKLQGLEQAVIAPDAQSSVANRPSQENSQAPNTRTQSKVSLNQSPSQPATPLDKNMRKKPKSRTSDLPLKDRPNPYASVASGTHPVRLHDLRELVTIKGHDQAISSMAFHPRKLVIVTVSDDQAWKLWNFPSGELLMTGEGHSDWIAGVDFHPTGTQLATSSGDMTVKLWDFSKARAIATLKDHTQPVWNCKYHDMGTMIISCSMDHTTKLWDLSSGKCRQTFRGHSDSVNDVAWQPFTNSFYTASGDKTISAWDARTGQCVHTLFGHVNAVNGITFAPRGNVFVSCDVEGKVKFWDTRALSELDSLDFGPHPINKVNLDMSGSVVAAASDTGACKLYNIRDKSSRDLNHRNVVQACVFDRLKGEYLATCSSDGTWKAWN